MNLTEDQRSELHTRLRDQAAELARRIDAMVHDGSSRELTLPQHAGDGESRAQTDVLNDEAIAQTELNQQLLADVNRALQRFGQGRYGTCVVCENPIPLERLRASPSAVCCLACQTALEHPRTL